VIPGGGILNAQLARQGRLLPARPGSVNREDLHEVAEGVLQGRGIGGEGAGGGDDAGVLVVPTWT
jgi:hypothetical protein